MTALAGGASAQSPAPQARPTNDAGTQNPPRRPSPTLFFAHFVDHPACFTAPLETVAQRRWRQTLDGVGGTEPNTIAVGRGEEEEAENLDQAAVWNTLLELYLDEGIEGDQNTACQQPSDCSSLPTFRTISPMRSSSARAINIRLG